MKILEVIAKNIKQARELSNLSQADLGQIVGLSQTQVSKIEKGISDTTITNLETFARALNISISDLMNIQDINKAIHTQHENTTFNIEPFAAIVGYAAELAEDSTHEERLRAARMLKRALTALEDSETERFTERESDGVAG
jgi:transcriptional regulator with XRE-family HTH domain